MMSFIFNLIPSLLLLVIFLVVNDKITDVEKRVELIQAEVHQHVHVMEKQVDKRMKRFDRVLFKAEKMLRIRQ